MQEENQWLINSYIVGQDGKTEIFSEDAHINKDKKYTWIHLDANYPESRKFLENNQKIDSIWVDAFLASETRPRIIEINNEAILINLRGINSIDKDEPEDMVSIRLYITKNSIITCQLRKLKAITKLKNDFDNNHAPLDIYDFISSLYGYICDEIEPTIFNLNNKIDDLEESILKESDLDIRQKIIDVRRQIIILKRYILPNIEVAKKLLSMTNIFGYKVVDSHKLSESCNTMVRFVEEMASVQERMGVVHEEINNHLTDRLNKNTFKLSIIATIFLPLTFLTGLFGVNIGGIPGDNNANGFLIFCLITFGIFILQLLAFKWIYRVKDV